MSWPIWLFSLLPTTNPRPLLVPSVADNLHFLALIPNNNLFNANPHHLPFLESQKKRSHHGPKEANMSEILTTKTPIVSFSKNLNLLVLMVLKEKEGMSYLLSRWKEQFHWKKEWIFDRYVGGYSWYSMQASERCFSGQVSWCKPLSRLYAFTTTTKMGPKDQWQLLDLDDN